MGDLNVIDRFMAAFIRYIDSGFGLLGGDVAFLTTVLVGIDITLAGLFWAMGGEDDVIGRFLKKILYVGAFALILGNFSNLADIIFRSFAGLGITAGGGTMSADDLLRPGHLAGTGFEAAWPLLEQASELMGFTSFFDNFLTIAILLIAWLFVIIAFFVLAIQLFITILEFKLTALAGFVLVPFALWNRTSFLAERVLGNVVSSGIKVMVLAVIVGIGSGFFGEFVGALNGQEPDIGQAMSLVLASLALFGLGIFGPASPPGLVAGAPQLGAGAAVGRRRRRSGRSAVGGGAALGGARAIAGGAMGALRAGTSMGARPRPPTGSGRRRRARPASAPALAASPARARAPRATGAELLAGSASCRARRAGRLLRRRLRSGGTGPALLRPPQPDGAPQWARRLRSEQSARHHRQVALQAVREGDRGGAGANPDIKERED
jgi:type IV secretion system protein TrbL